MRQDMNYQSAGRGPPREVELRTEQLSGLKPTSVGGGGIISALIALGAPPKVFLSRIYIVSNPKQERLRLGPLI